MDIKMIPIQELDTILKLHHLSSKVLQTDTLMLTLY